MNNIDTITAQSVADRMKRHFNNCEFPEIGVVLGSGLASINNMAARITRNKNDHADVVDMANRMTAKFSDWVKQIILNI